MAYKSLKFTSNRNRFEEEKASERNDNNYMKYREKMYEKDHSPSIKGLGFYVFLIVVFLLSYILFTKTIFAG
jgi:hypothetical protein